MARLVDRARPVRVCEGVYIKDVPVEDLEAASEEKGFMPFLIANLCDENGEAFEDLHEEDDLKNLPVKLQEAIMEGVKSVFSAPDPKDKASTS